MSDIASYADLIFEDAEQIKEIPINVLLGFLPSLLALIGMGLAIYVAVKIFQQIVR